MTCAECRLQALIGTRCLKCWLSRRARNLGISKYKWFYMNRERLEPMLMGRWLVIQMGEEPAPIETVYQIFYNGDYSYHRGGSEGRIRASRPQKQIKQLVESLDKQARKQYGGKEE
jgi:hypothetical protein